MKQSISLVFLVILITIINYFDRTALSYTILPIEQQLGLNNAQFGTAASFFGIGYMIMTFFSGLIIDRLGPIRVWGISALFWSLITMLLGTSNGFFSLALLMGLLGLAEGFNSPALLRTITDWLDPTWRARALSFSLMGVPIASVIGAPLMTSLLTYFGWRWMFFSVGSLGIIWAIFWFFFFHNRHSPYSFRAPHSTPWRKLLTDPCFRANAFSFFTFGNIVFFMIIWLPGYLQQTFGLAIERTGFLVVFAWLSATLFQFIGGWLIDTIWKRTHSILYSRICVLSAGFLCTSIAFSLLAYSSHLQTSIVLIAIGLGFAFMTNPAIYSINADLFPNHIATAQGISTSCFALAGFVSPILTGWITEVTGHYKAAILWVAALTLLASLNAFFSARSRLKER